MAIITKFPMSILLIVESPTKAKTITKFLGKGYEVLSSFGHIRDLPARKIGVDVKNGFEPTYEVPVEKKAKVKALQDAAKKATEIYLATDEDREGEAIAWHIAEVLKINTAQAKRITFHEITKSAIERALKESRTIDTQLVDAQQTRRILDRLVGYELSPFLWKKVRRGLSAGRVQSVAVRIIVERERERQAFVTQDYWTIDATFAKNGTPFEAKLSALNGKALEKTTLNNEAEAEQIAQTARTASFIVSAIEKKEVQKKCPVPLTTSTLQQEAYNRLGMSAKQTMTLAQKLYETGRITYMRTDSTNLSEEFLTAAQAFIKSAFGAEYAKGPTRYKTSKKGAQEAHEAIRPTDATLTGDAFKETDADTGLKKLYDLIWRRTIASQLPPARVERTGINLSAEHMTFRATGAVVVFPGYMKVWKASDDKILPEFIEQEQIGAPQEVTSEKHTTEPPARYSDATLVKSLEEYGIGRPSTYAPTIATITDRGYILRDDNNRLQPADIAFIVSDLLKEHFPQIVDYEFTASMENNLDEIAEGKQKWRSILAEFYTPFHTALETKTKELSREDISKKRVLGNDPETGLPIFVQTGRFGAYVQVGEEEEGKPKPRRASLPKDALVDLATLEDALRALILPRTVGKNAAGEDIIANDGRFGPYLKAGEINASLPQGIDPRTVSLEDAIRIMSETKERKERMLTPLATLGKHPETGAEILVKDGRFGPYVTDGKTNATINKKIDPLSVTLEDAVEMIAKKAASPKKTFRRRKGS